MVCGRLGRLFPPTSPTHGWTGGCEPKGSNVVARELLRRVVEPSHRSALEGYAVRVVEQSVEDGVAEGGIADDIVPVFDGDLAGEERAAAGVAVVEDLEEVVSSLAGERSEPPVVEDEEPRPGEPLDELGIRPVAAGEGEFVKQAGDAVVARRDAGAAGLVAQRARQVGLSRSGGPADEHGLAVADPLSGGEAQDEGAVQSAGALKLMSSMVASRWSLAWPFRRW